MSRSDHLDPKTCKHEQVICTDCTTQIKMPTQDMLDEVSKDKQKLREMAKLLSGRSNSDWIPKHRVKQILEGRF